MSVVAVAHRGADGTVEFLSAIVRDLTERKRIDAELRRGADDCLQMRGNLMPMLLVGIQRIGIVAESRDGDTVLFQKCVDACDFLVAEVRNVQVRHAGITAIRLSGWPAHQLDTGESLVRGEGKHFLQRQVAEDGADESQVHDASLILVSRDAESSERSVSSVLAGHAPLRKASASRLTGVVH